MDDYVLRSSLHLTLYFTKAADLPYVFFRKLHQSVFKNIDFDFEASRSSVKAR